MVGDHFSADFYVKWLGLSLEEEELQEHVALRCKMRRRINGTGVVAFCRFLLSRA